MISRDLLELEVAWADRFQTMVMHDQGRSMTELAGDAGVSRPTSPGSSG